MRLSLAVALFDPGVRAGLADLRASFARAATLPRPASGTLLSALAPSGDDMRRLWFDHPLHAAAAGTVWCLGAAALVAGAAGLIIAALTALPGRAVALDLFSEPARTEAFLSGLHQIADGGARALTAMFGLLNLALLAVCGLAILAIAVQAVLDTARGGRPGASGVMVLRVVLVLALVTPLGGFSAAQHGVLAVAGFGGSVADRLWAAFSAEAIGEGAPPMPAVAENVHRRLVADLLVAETCRESVNRLAVAHGDPPYVAVRDRGLEDGHVVVGYDGVGRGLPLGACGAVRFARGHEDGAGGHVLAARYRAVSTVLDEVRTVARGLADRLVPGGPLYGQPLPPVRRDLDGRGIARRYAATLQQGIAEARAASSGEIAGEVGRQHGGWLEAPLAFNVIARRSGAMQAAVREVPTVDPPAPALGRGVPEWPDILAAVRAWVLDAGAGAGVPAAAPPVSDRALFRILDQVWHFRSDLVDADAPLSSLAAIGHTLVSGAVQAFGVVAGLMTGSSLLRGVPFIGSGLDVAAGAWQVLDAPVTTALMALLSAGLILAYLVPLIPFVRFLFALAGWLFLLIEGLVGVGLWLLSWLSTDRDMIMPGRARDGVLLLLGLLIRPPLMIIGLLLGFLVATVLVRYLNAGLAPLIENVANGGAGPVGRIAWTVIYTILAWIVVNLAFAATDRLPAGVMQWLGARADSVTDGDGSARSITAALGRTERMAPRLGSRAGERRS